MINCYRLFRNESLENITWFGYECASLSLPTPHLCFYKMVRRLYL